MSAVVIVASLLEAIKLATTLVEKLNKDEITPEEAEAEWKKTSSRWRGAVDSWNRQGD